MPGPTGGTASQYILPPTLREFRESFPGFTIKIEQCSSRQAADSLLDEQLDLALGRRHLKRSWGVLYSKSRKLSLAENVFINLSRKVFQELTNVQEP